VVELFELLEPPPPPQLDKVRIKIKIAKSLTGVFESIKNSRKVRG